MVSRNRSFFQVLVWNAAPLRFLFEGLIVLFLFQLFSIVIYSRQGHFDFVMQLGLFVVLASGMIFLDTAVICSSLTKWKNSFIAAISGEISLSLRLVESLLTSSLPPPQSLLQIRRAELLFMNGENNSAESALNSALTFGASIYDCDLARCRGRLFSYNCEFENENTDSENGISSLIAIESGMISLFRKNDYRKTLSYIENVLEQHPQMHPSYANTYDLAHLLKLCVNLHTGKAEQVLPQLGALLHFLKYQITMAPELRPYISFAYLERAKYYARRRNTAGKSLDDISLALAICNYPAQRKIGNEIKASLA